MPKLNGHCLVGRDNPISLKKQLCGIFHGVEVPRGLPRGLGERERERGRTATVDGARNVGEVEGQGRGGFGRTSMFRYTSRCVSVGGLTSLLCFTSQIILILNGLLDVLKD